MPPRTTADRNASRRQTSLQRLLAVAKAILQQADKGLEPRLTALDLTTAARVAREHEQQLRLRQNDLEALWTYANQNKAAYLALFFLALRRSAPCHASEGPEFSYASLRDCLSEQLGLYSGLTDDATWRSFCCHLLGPAVLRADALQCYSRLLSQTAEQLKPAAAAALRAAHPEAAAFSLPTEGPHAEAALAGAAGTSRGRSGQGKQHENPKPKPPSLAELEPLLRNVLQMVKTFTNGCLFGTVDGATTGPCPVGHPMYCAREQLQSSWVLEHWAQVLLLGSAAATVGERSRERLTAQGKQADLLSGLCHQLNRSSYLPFSDVLLRPCGCALAATHMAQLCAALDGGDAFGAAKPELLVLPAFVINEQSVTAYAEMPALQRDAVLALTGRAVSVHVAVVIVEAWGMLLAEALADGPHAVVDMAAAVGEATAEALGGRGAGASVGHGGGGGPGVEQGPAAGHTAAAGGSLCRLPPYDRAATVHLCLRLAKGLLASWGAPLQGVMPDTCVRGPNRVNPVLPPTSTSVLIHQALACARLALLPAVWGRERVPRRSWEQLLAWWETYLAAAQHPEALMVSTPEQLKFPRWTHTMPEGVAARPSADAAAAIKAGLILCMTWWATRMGATCDASSAGALWSIPDSFPGVKACWRHVYQLGPLVQLGDLVSAVGRRLRGAVEEQRAFAAAMASVKDWRRVPKGGDLRTEVLRETMSMAQRCLFHMHIAMVYCSGGAGAAEVAAEAAGGVEDAEGVDDAWCMQRALRSSFALAELLPPLVHGVLLCAELLPWARRVEGQAREAAGQGGAEEDVAMLGQTLQRLIDGSYECASTALVSCITLMTWYGGLPAGEREGGGGASGSGGGGGGDGGGGDGDGGGGGSSGGSSGGGSNSGDSRSSGGGRTDNGGGSSGAPCAFDPAWRQLLLRDVRLMELLGAGLALQREAEVQAMQGVQRDEESTREFLRGHLAHAVTLAAACFPEELRAAAGVGAGAGRAEAAAHGQGAGAAGGAAAAAAARPCISLRAVRSLPAVQAVMLGKGGEPSVRLDLVAAVLEDGGMRTDAQRALLGFARMIRSPFTEPPCAARYLAMLVPP